MSRKKIGKATFKAVIVNWFPLHTELLQLRISLPESCSWENAGHWGSIASHWLTPWRLKEAKRRQRKNKCMIGRTRHVFIPPNKVNAFKKSSFREEIIISCFLQALRGRRRENRTGNRDSETMENREVRVLTRAGRVSFCKSQIGLQKARSEPWWVSLLWFEVILLLVYVPGQKLVSKIVKKLA
jgi:hypothetical protein